MKWLMQRGIRVANRKLDVTILSGGVQWRMVGKAVGEGWVGMEKASVMKCVGAVLFIGRWVRTKGRQAAEGIGDGVVFARLANECRGTFFKDKAPTEDALC